MEKSFVFFLLFVNIVYSFDKPRGIPFSKLSLYRPEVPFKCLDGSGTIDWRKVNDDYCDCRDGTDEPGTPACHNGLFYCENKGHKSQYILSSRVNDGVCDCCDSQDEYSGRLNCSNNCWELGSIERERVKQLKIAADKGHEVFKQYVLEFESNIGEKKTRLDTINQEMSAATEEKLAAERTKTDAEATETEAKRKNEEALKEMTAINETEKEKQSMERAFQELDIDNDGKIVYEELQSHQEFDIDQNGDVSPEEAKEYLSEHDFVDATVFADTVWPNIRQIFRFKPLHEEKPEGAVPEPRDAHDEDEHKDDEQHREDVPPVTEEKPTKEKMEYDDDTNKLIEVADQARNLYNEVSDKYNKLENEKKQIEELLNLDYGPKSAYYRLAVDESCYELTDREYTYKLCPFRRAAQQSSGGGGDTELGKWGRWGPSPTGSQAGLYSVQTYDNGLPCWNGPNRQTKVEIGCGAENKLLSASEPSRCEYLFKFETPAACDRPASEIDSLLDHDEL